MLHILLDVLRNSILITGLVIVMMMMIESINIESSGLFFKGLRKTRLGQVVFGALLGSIPGCMGGFATVSLYTHRMFSFGALVAMMIASSGDEAFIMLAMIPEQALVLFAVLFVLAVITGVITDKVHDRFKVSGIQLSAECEDGYKVHHEIEHKHDRKRHFGWRRVVMFIGLAVFIAALATGRLGHEHHHDTCVEHNHELCHEHHVHEADHTTGALHIDLLSEDWMYVLFAGLSLIVLVVLITASDHFVEEHLWNHVIRKHLPVIFAWTFGVLAIVSLCLPYIDIEHWISSNTVLMILLATAIGIIPESGPHMIFVTLFAAGIVPFPVLLASSISQDGHASLPLIAESKMSFVWAKLINCGVAIGAGLFSMLFV